MALVTEKSSGRRVPTLPRKPVGRVPRSQKERLWLIGGGTIALLLTVVAFFFFISPQRSDTSDVQGRVDSARSQNSVLQARLNQLREQNKSLGKYRQELAAAQSALPSAADVSDFLRSLQSLGSQTETNVVSLTVGPPANVSAAANGQLVAGAPGAAPSASPSASAGAGAANPAPAGGAPGGAAAGPGVYSLPVKAEVTGSPADLNRFLDQLQNVQPRAVLITSVVETSGNQGTGPGGQTVGTVLDLSLQVFVATAPTPAAATGTGTSK